MPNLCFKARKGSRTVQIVRHVYDPKLQRSRTVTLGSMPLDADPQDFAHELRLRPGVALNDEDARAISRWLLLNGDAAAAQRRQIRVERIAARVRAEVMEELSRQSGDVIEQAVTALEAAKHTLPALAAQARDAGSDVWKSLRPRYLALHGAWERLMKTAQAVGVAKRRRTTKSLDRVE